MEEPKTCISDLTDDLLAEILLRVPWKSTFQYKSVSIRWFDIISSRYFSKSFHRLYNIKRWPRRLYNLNFYSKEVLLISRKIPDVDFPLSLSFLPCLQTFLPCFQTSGEEGEGEGERRRRSRGRRRRRRRRRGGGVGGGGGGEEEGEEASIVGSSEGLLLCCSTRDNKKIYCVCNPLTKEWDVLPLNPSSHEQQEVRIGFTCYQPYHYFSSSYEVVLLTKFLGSKSQIKVEIFSSVTRQWTEFIVSCPHNIEINFCGNVIPHKGKLHWFLPSDNKIVVYDYKHNKVPTIIDGPEETDPLLHSQCFDVFRGSVRIARLQTPQSSLSLWGLRSKSGKWRLEHQINLKEVISTSKLADEIGIVGEVNVLAFHLHSDTVYLGLSKRIVACNMLTKTIMFSYKPPSTVLQPSIYVLHPWPTPIPMLPFDAWLSP